MVQHQTDDADTNAQILGQNLQRLRAAQALTQAEVARRAGIARTHYAALESGSSSNGATANPRLITLLNLAHALQTPVEELLQGLQPAAPHEGPTAT
ncbi:helix-turn-helix transcriptional regulator [Nocardioides sp.]|uniref:helix-turn-helix transcriptional regulator n=1 Tax=Nocardioides sp. TaxID=35761 RepID=UPI00272067A7|nr:helix-turn-helix transcriptional regulator [Nocardioides sp.]MDO9455231.1 helix-turn-helix transcriptional regulator [Nocardioides sp.]